MEKPLLSSDRGPTPHAAAALGIHDAGTVLLVLHFVATPALAAAGAHPAAVPLALDQDGAPGDFDAAALTPQVRLRPIHRLALRVSRSPSAAHRRSLEACTPPGSNRLPKNLLLARLLKKVQMQGGAPGTHPPGWAPIRMGTRQLGLFQQPTSPDYSRRTRE